MININCLCGNNSDFIIVYKQNFTEDQVSSSESFSPRGEVNYKKIHFHYRLLRCRSCSQLFSSPILEPEKIKKLYSGAFHEYDEEHENIIKAYLKPIQKWSHIIANNDAILEVGCGSGFVLEAIKTEIGFKEAIGIEPSVNAVNKANKNIKDKIRNCMFEEANLDKNSLDLICAFQVLDHFVDPISVIKTFKDLLKPRGLLYVIVHNEQALHVKIFGDKSSIIDISHIYLFNKKTLKKFFEMFDFEFVDLFDIWNTYSINMWLRMTPIPFKEKIIKIFKVLKLDKATISFPAGNIGIILKKNA